MKRIITTLIILSGVFFCKVFNSTRFYPAQFGFFVFSFGLLTSILLYQKNKWIGLLCGLSSIVFLKTYLLQQAPQVNLFEHILMGISIFGVYYIVRQSKPNEDYLKYFMIPAIANVILVIIQKFDHILLLFMPVRGVQGFLGNPSISGCFMALTTPIFCKYFRKGLPLLFLGVIISGSVVAIMMFILGLCIYEWLIRYKNRKLLLILCSALVVLGCFHYRNKIIEDIKYRSAMWLGTLSGIKHNPILGWGIGSFEPIMTKIPSEQTKYGWSRFNDGVVVMNHPHNEVLYGWWNMGILFPILFFGLVWQTIRKFKQGNELAFSILILGLFCMMFYFLQPPLWFLTIFALGIYHNKGDENETQRNTEV